MKIVQGIACVALVVAILTFGPLPGVAAVCLWAGCLIATAPADA